VVGADRATVLRRWRRMEEAGAAWIACYPVETSELALAIVEISCMHARTLEVAEQLAKRPARGDGERVRGSRATAQRRLSALLAVHPVMRCELARSLTPWPVCAAFFMHCPADKIDVTAQALSMLREVRAVMVTVGPCNLCISAWVRSVGDVYLLEAQLATRMPHLRIADRAFVIRPVKLMGQLLDEEGLRIGTVPIDLRQSPLDLT
jgi:hypothetical protein